MSGFSSQDKIAAAPRGFNFDVSAVEKSENELRDMYELDKCVDWIVDNDYKRTCLQFPENLLNDSISVALYLENLLQKNFYVLADTAFGSCCVDHISSEHVNADSIIHFGHACLSSFSKLPVLYIFEKEDLDVDKFETAMSEMMPTNHNIIIFYEDIYHHLHDRFQELFSGRSNVEVSKVAVPEHCNGDIVSARKLFGRVFHFKSSDNTTAVFIGRDCSLLQNLTLALPGVKWYLYTVNELTEYDFNRSKFLMKKYHQIELVKDAEIVGILIGTLGIESYLDAIERIKHLAKKNGKRCYILAVGRPNVNKLANFPEIDVFVSVSCTENLSKDFKEYYKPIVSLFEVEMALGGHSFTEEYVNDFGEVLSNYHSSDLSETSCEAEVSLVSGKVRANRNNLVPISSMELQERMPGTVVEAKGIEYLTKRSWRGLDDNLERNDVLKAEIGRSGIPVGYENEYSTLNEIQKSE